MVRLRKIWKTQGKWEEIGGNRARLGEIGRDRVNRGTLGEIRGD